MTGKRRIVGMTVCVLFAVSVLAWMILGHPDRQAPYYPSNEPSPQVSSAPQAPASYTLLPDKPALPATPPAPNYSMEDAGEYGYEGALSQDDLNAGKAVKPVIMARYLGEKDGTYSVQMHDGAAVQRLSCKAPCTFIKISYIYAGQVIKTEAVRTTGNSVMDAVFDDAMNGLLRPYAGA